MTSTSQTLLNEAPGLHLRGPFEVLGVSSSTQATVLSGPASFQLAPADDK